MAVTTAVLPISSSGERAPLRSAGIPQRADFRDLLYLSSPYAAYHLPTEPDPVFPDLYLHTDYFPWGTADFLNRQVLHWNHQSIHAETLAFQMCPFDCF